MRYNNNGRWLYNINDLFLFFLSAKCSFLKADGSFCADDDLFVLLIIKKFLADVMKLRRIKLKEV